jgi:glycerol uptake facilitator-like aquaporin
LEFAAKDHENFSHKEALLVHGTLFGFSIIVLVLFFMRMSGNQINDAGGNFRVSFF